MIIINPGDILSFLLIISIMVYLFKKYLVAAMLRDELFGHSVLACKILLI